ncbi:hypothetical protein ACFQ1S_40995, partial [Kibdelosporangium lantanae]
RPVYLPSRPSLGGAVLLIVLGILCLVAWVVWTLVPDFVDLRVSSLYFLPGVVVFLVPGVILLIRRSGQRRALIAPRPENPPSGYGWPPSR